MSSTTSFPTQFKPKLDEDREIDFSYNVPGIGRFRTNCYQHLGKWCLAMRHVVAEVPKIDSLGLPEIIKSIAEEHRGIVLVAGTTGCGKSTTLAGMIDHINSTQKRHIITIEDPVEYVFKDKQSIIEQREVGLDTPSYQHSLKHVMRQDPDVIMIGEMRDAISFRAAMSAADTGHLVMSTLHTIDAPQSISRVLDFFPADGARIRAQADDRHPQGHHRAAHDGAKRRHRDPRHRDHDQHSNHLQAD